MKARIKGIFWFSFFFSSQLPKWWIMPWSGSELNCQLQKFTDNGWHRHPLCDTGGRAKGGGRSGTIQPFDMHQTVHKSCFNPFKEWLQVHFVWFISCSKWQTASHQTFEFVLKQLKSLFSWQDWKTCKKKITCFETTLVSHPQLKQSSHYYFYVLPSSWHLYTMLNMWGVYYKSILV